jgi:hypothetical protein
MRSCRRRLLPNEVKEQHQFLALKHAGKNETAPVVMTGAVFFAPDSLTLNHSPAPTISETDRTIVL